MPTKLTKRIVDAFTVPQGSREAWLWDAELPGFGLRAHASGFKAFAIQYRVGTRTRRLSLGPYGRLTVDEARRKAREELAKVAVESADPSAERKAARRSATVADLAERYIEQHAAAKKKERSVSEDRRILAGYVLPVLANHPVADVNRADIDRLHHGMRATPIQANRVLALLSKMFNLAERWGMRPDGTNPCRHVEKYKERKRERYLDSDELACLGRVLAELEAERTIHPTFFPLVRLLILTGARLDEIRTLRWEFVDLKEGVLRLPDSKTGAKVIHLPAAARQILASIDQRSGNPFVIWGRVDGAPLVNASKPWLQVRKRAGLDDVRLHDLRHTFASVAVSGGASLPLIGKILGHKQPATTARYAHAQRDPVAELAGRVGDKIAATMNQEEHPTAEILDLGRARA